MATISSFKKYASLVKFSHSIFAMPFALIGFSLAIFWDDHPFDAQKLIFVIVCMITARNAAMAFNRWLDAKYDALNERTANREIPAGIVSSKSALIFVIINCVLFCASSFMLAPICFYLSPIALFVILFYSYTKRFTAFCHLVLGIGLSLAPIGAYLAIAQEFSVIPVLLGFVVFTWVAGFDIIYALQDQEFDKAQDLNSIPAWLGTEKALVFSNILHLVSSLLILFIGLRYFWTPNDYTFWLGAVFFWALLGYQHILVKPNDFSKINLAFFTTNGIGSILFAICFIANLMLRK
jgi:4-hydroxybenzoate polyprenyltransferase